MSTHTKSLWRWIAGSCGVLIVLTAAMAYLLWNDRQLTYSSDKGRHAQASTVRIVQGGFEDILLTRNDTHWSVEQPCSIAANSQRLEPLLGALQPGAHPYSASEVDLQAAGLLTPEATVYIDDVEYRIGKTDLQGNRRYVQHDNVVEFAPEWILSLINGGLTAFADPALFKEELVGLQITDLEGKRRDISSPSELQPWQTLSALQVVTWPLPDETINLQDSREWQVTLAGQKPQTFTAYSSKKLTALHAESGGCVYILGPDSLSQL